MLVRHSGGNLECLSLSLFGFTREVDLYHCHFALSHNCCNISRIFDKAASKYMVLLKKQNYEQYSTFQPCIQKDDPNGWLLYRPVCEQLSTVMVVWAWRGAEMILTFIACFYVRVVF